MFEQINLPWRHRQVVHKTLSCPQRIFVQLLQLGMSLEPIIPDSEVADISTKPNTNQTVNTIPWLSSCSTFELGAQNWTRNRAVNMMEWLPTSTRLSTKSSSQHEIELLTWSPDPAVIHTFESVNMIPWFSSVSTFESWARNRAVNHFFCLSSCWRQHIWIGSMKSSCEH